MATHAKTEPEWYSLSHRDRYRRLTEVRRAWCRRPVRDNKDYQGRTVHLDGTWITDVSGFYLSLGEAINGPSGYFGGDLDALSDCLCGGFGVLPPLTIRLSYFNDVRNVLDGRAWCRFRAESFREAVAAGEDRKVLVDWGYLGDGSPADVARWTVLYEAALTGEPFECAEFSSYFDAVLEVLEERRAALVPENLG